MQRRREFFAQGRKRASVLGFLTTIVLVAATVSGMPGSATATPAGPAGATTSAAKTSPAQSSTKAAPATTSAVPSTSKAAPATTSAATTSAAGSSTKAAPATTSAAPSSAKVGPATTSAAPSSTKAVSTSTVPSSASPTSRPTVKPSSSARSTATPAVAPAKLSVLKTANPTTVSAAGDQITYSFLVKNTGGTVVTGVAIADTFTGSGNPTVTGVRPASAPGLTITCPLTTLPLSGSTTCTGVWTVTQANIDDGTISNTATASGLDPASNRVVSPASSATVDVAPNVGLSVLSTSTTSSITSVGQVAPYAFLATNQGSQTIHGLVVTATVNAPGTSGQLSTITCPAATLAPNASTTCTANYTAEQADLDSSTGAVVVTATAHSLDPQGTVIDSGPSPKRIPTTPPASLSVEKSADPTTVAKAGDPIVYSFVVSNTGQATLTSISIDDVFTGSGNAAAVPRRGIHQNGEPAFDITCPVTTLAPNENTTCTGTYSATQGDIDAGAINNTATASGISPEKRDHYLRPVVCDGHGFRGQQHCRSRRSRARPGSTRSARSSRTRSRLPTPVRRTCTALW